MTTDQFNLDLAGESPNTAYAHVMALPEGTVAARLFVDAAGQFACPDVLDGKGFYRFLAQIIGAEYKGFVCLTATLEEGGRIYKQVKELMMDDPDVKNRHMNPHSQGAIFVILADDRRVILDREKEYGPVEMNGRLPSLDDVDVDESPYDARKVARAGR